MTFSERVFFSFFSDGGGGGCASTFDLFSWGDCVSTFDLFSWGEVGWGGVGLGTGLGRWLLSK